MQRDLDKIRNIMLYLEENLIPGKEISSSDIPYYEENNDNDYLVLTEHIRQLVEINFIEEHNIRLSGLTIYYIKRITSDGHDFIQAIKNESVWNQTKDMAKKAGGGTIPIMVEFAKEYIKSRFSLTS